MRLLQFAPFKAYLGSGDKKEGPRTVLRLPLRSAPSALSGCVPRADVVTQALAEV